MRILEVARTTAFRTALAVGACFTALTFPLFAFTSRQVSEYQYDRLEAAIYHKSRILAEAPFEEAAEQLEVSLKDDARHVHYAALFGSDGQLVVGNMSTIPADLPFDGVAHQIVVPSIDQDDDEDHEVILAIARRLESGRLLVVGRDMDDIEELHDVASRARFLGFVPALALSLAIGAVLGRRTDRRVRAMHEVIGRVMQGRLGERLPVRGAKGDEFDQLATGINAMLAELEQLVEEIRGVGDSVAHDLRTPLTRARARLERCRDLARTPAEFQDTIDRALGWMDQTLGTITAVLRIGQIEHGRRRAAFASVDLVPLVREVAELYDPVAEDKGVRLSTASFPAPPVLGDRDLIFEALANLVDNAVKFTPAEGEVHVALEMKSEAVVIRVADTGCGIPPAERTKVTQRFYRADASRHSPGSGLGLSLVAAIVRLHGFTLTISGEQGCMVELTCPLAHRSVPGETKQALPACRTDRSVG